MAEALATRLRRSAKNVEIDGHVTAARAMRDAADVFDPHARSLVARMRKSDLATAVREWRDAHNLSAKAAAENLGISPRTLEGIEQGRPFRYEKILRLALECDLT